MATTNNQIILMECATRGIVEPVHTYAKWQELGFQVQKGQKALFKTAIYKCVEKKDADGNTTSKKMFPKMSVLSENRRYADAEYKESQQGKERDF